MMEDEHVEYSDDAQRQSVVHDEPEHDNSFGVVGTPFLTERIAETEWLVAVDSKILRIKDNMTAGFTGLLWAQSWNCPPLTRILEPRMAGILQMMARIQIMMAIEMVM